VNVLRQANYSYDQNTGNTLQELDAICPGSYRTNAYGYDQYNNRVSSTNAAAVVTQTAYDSASETFPVTTTEGGSFITSTTYDVRSGKLFSSTDWAGLVVSNRYDSLLRLVEKYCSPTPNGSPTEWLAQYTYTLGDSSGPQNSVLHQQSDGVDLSNGHETMTWFDGLRRIIQGRVESETSGEYRTVDTIYDQRGNVEFVSLPYLSSGTSRSTPVTELGAAHGYDPIGRPSQLTEVSTGTFSGGLLSSMSGPVGDTSSPVGMATVTYYYNNSGTLDPWTWVVTDANTNTHRYTRDAYGRTNTIAEVNGSQTYTTTLNWNLASDLLSVTDNVANVIQYSNNLVGEIVAMADPDMGVWKYERDYAGRIRSQTDGDGQTIQYNYSPDPLGRLLSRQVYDLKGNFYYGITNVYDTNSGDTGFSVYKGQPYETIDSEGFAEYGYDVRGRKTITRRFLSKNGNFYTNQYSYDDVNRVRSIVYPNEGPTITNIYDTGANLSEVQQVGGAGTTYYHATSFSPLDQISNIAYANNAFSSTYSYYANSKRLSGAQTGSMQNLGYTYADAVGDIGGITDTAYTGTASAAISGIGYDGLHRLTGFTRNSQTVTFTYDTIGDMLTDTENGSTSYVYSTPAGTRLPHAVKSANGLNYAYDTTGNMLVRGTEALMYNPENRLIALAVSNQVITFGYDADGNRLWKQSPTNSLQVWIDSNYEEKDGKILFHISAGKRIVYTYSSDASVAEYYIPDHLHSAEIMVTVTNSVAVAQHYEYTAYGNSRYILSTTSFPITHRYTSQPFDDETGLYYYGNSRYYDPVIGRFIQPDGIIPNFFDPQTYDRYAYARDNPLRYTDPTGHGLLDAIAEWIAKMRGRSQLDAYALSLNRGYTGWSDMQQKLAEAKDYNGTATIQQQRAEAVSTTGTTAAALGGAYVTVAPELATAGLATPATATTTVERTGAQTATEEGGTAAETATGSAEGSSSSSIYRGATQGNPNHVSLREGESAVSFRDSLSNPVPAPGTAPQPVLRPGRNYIEVDTAKLPSGSVVHDGGTVVNGSLMPPGHVSVTATPAQIVNATVGGGKFPK
jgi:RHS repeat-associated protein